MLATSGATHLILVSLATRALFSDDPTKDNAAVEETEMRAPASYHHPGKFGLKRQRPSGQ